MSPLYDMKIGPTFETRIKIGAVIGQDFRAMKWPKCLPPSSQGCGDYAKDPNMIFTARRTEKNP